MDSNDDKGRGEQRGTGGVSWVARGEYAESEACYWKVLTKSGRGGTGEREVANEYCRLVAETAVGLFIECWPASP